jgi:hypothetical protein
MGHFFVVTALLPEIFVADRGIVFTYLIAILFFLFVLLRNYLVMHAIDTAEHRSDGAFRFLLGNEGLADFFERMFRFLIMLTVIITPKGAYSWAMAVVRLVERVGTKLVLHVAAFFSAGLPHQFKPESFMHDALPYYAAVLLLLFLEFLFWDLSNVVALGMRMRKVREALVVDLERGLISDSGYRAMLRYFNICRARPGGMTEAVFFEVGYLQGRYPLLINRGSVGHLYFTSSKFLERLFGLLAATSILAAAIYEFAAPVIVVCTIAIALYASQASRNDRYFSAMVGHVKFPVSYFRSGVNPFS